MSEEWGSYERLQEKGYEQPKLRTLRHRCRHSGHLKKMVLQWGKVCPVHTETSKKLSLDRTQASSRYPSYQRRLATECDSAIVWFFPTRLTGDVTSEIAEDDWKWGCKKLRIRNQPLVRSFNPRTYKQIHTPTVVQGGGGELGVDGIPHRSFWYVAVLWNDFTFSGKPLIFLTRWGIFYGWWCCWRLVTSLTMVAILAAILDFTKNWKSG